MIRYEPLRPGLWSALEALFGSTGACGRPGACPARARMKTLVESGKALGILGFDGDVAVGWCSFGPRTDFLRIETVKAYRRDDGTSTRRSAPRPGCGGSPAPWPGCERDDAPSRHASRLYSGRRRSAPVRAVRRKPAGVRPAGSCQRRAGHRPRGTTSTSRSTWPPTRWVAGVRLHLDLVLGPPALLDLEAVRVDPAPARPAPLPASGWRRRGSRRVGDWLGASPRPSNHLQPRLPGNSVHRPVQPLDPRPLLLGLGGPAAVVPGRHRE